MKSKGDGQLEVEQPHHVQGHNVTKLIHKLAGQPDSYINKQNYVFGRTLGAGSFGVVRQARMISTDEDVAVKIILKKALKGKDVHLQMLYDELAILQRLHHPNIVAFKDWFESRDKFYIVTQLAVGGELFDRIVAKGKFTENDAIAIIVQILKAVDYMHTQNIVHRDLKPENVLYVDKSDDSELVVADFGIAKQLKTDDDLVYKAAGSLGYVAPEVLTTNGHGKPCDIWSIGVITYTLLSGYSPFIAESVDGFLEECTSGGDPVKFHRPYWDNISQNAKDFILAALDLDPNTRPTASELLNHSWIVSEEKGTKNILPSVKKEYDLRKKLRDAIEIVKLNNRIKKLRLLYVGDDDQDLEENSNADSLNLSSISKNLKDLRLKSKANASEMTPEQIRLKSAVTQDAFALLVNAARINKDKILADDSEADLNTDQNSTQNE